MASSIVRMWLLKSRNDGKLKIWTWLSMIITWSLARAPASETEPAGAHVGSGRFYLACINVFMTGVHLSTSLWRKAVNSTGDIVFVRMASLARALRTSSRVMLAFTSRLRASTIPFGRFAGPEERKPRHQDQFTPADSSRDRRSAPCRECAAASVSRHRRRIRRACDRGCRRPGETYSKPRGYAENLAKVLMPREGCTTSTIGALPKYAMCVKSRIGSQAMRSCMTGARTWNGMSENHQP